MNQDDKELYNKIHTYYKMDEVFNPTLPDESDDSETPTGILLLETLIDPDVKPGMVSSVCPFAEAKKEWCIYGLFDFAESNEDSAITVEIHKSAVAGHMMVAHRNPME